MVHHNSLFDEDNPLSLAKKLPKEYLEIFRELIKKVPADDLDKIQNEKDLKGYLWKIENYSPSGDDARIRFLFWQEYERAVYEDCEMLMANIHGGIHTPNTFKKLYCRRVSGALFLITKPIVYRHAIQEALLLGVEKLRSILEMDPVDSSGKINTKLLDVQVKVVSILDLRLNGSPTQRVHNVSQIDIKTSTQVASANNTNIANVVNALVKKGDMDALQKRLMELEKEKRKVRGLAAPIEVEESGGEGSEAENDNAYAFAKRKPAISEDSE